MATVPNYYYNSPWIEAAGRNLASALAPPDREKQLALQEEQWKFGQAQEAAARDAETRTKHDKADKGVSELLAMQPIMGADGKIDEKATEAAARQKFGEIVNTGGTGYFDVASKAAGTASPTFAVAEAIKNLGIQASQNNLWAQINAGFQRQGRDQEFRRGMQSDQHAFLSTEQDQRLAHDADVWTARLQAQANKDAAKAGKGAGGKPPMIFGERQREVALALLRKITLTGKKITPEDQDHLFALGNRYAGQIGDGQSGADAAWETAFPNETNYADTPGTYEHPPADPSSFGGRLMQAIQAFSPSTGRGDEYLSPKFPDESLGGASVTPPAATAPVVPHPKPVNPGSGSRAPTTVTGAPPARLLKEGFETTFTGKGTWTLKNGVPTRVR